MKESTARLTNSFKNIHPVNIKYKKILLGLLVTAFSFITPKILWEMQFNILRNIHLSLENYNTSLLIIAAIQLVFLNTIRHLPIFLGIFIISDDFYHTLKSKSEKAPENPKYSVLRNNLAFLFPFVFTPVIYQLISRFYNMSFVFSNVSILAIIFMFIIYKFIQDVRYVFIKIIIVTLIVFAFDCVDIIPIFSRLNFGRGDLTSTIHQTAEFIGATQIINVLGIIFSAILLVNIAILAKMSTNYQKYLHLMEENKNKESKMSKMQMEALESRYYIEIKNLVHDLKTPLTTIQGLSDLIQLGLEESKVKEYANKITGTTEKMNLIISEVLLEDKKNTINIEDLFEFVKSQILCDDFYNNVSFEINQDVNLKINKYRMSRAIINLIDNALKAANQKDQAVVVKAAKNDVGVEIIIKDNGPGISAENLEKVWEPGFALNPEDTGLGLNFVKNVVENHEGEIYIESRKGMGTEVHIILKE